MRFSFRKTVGIHCFLRDRECPLFEDGLELAVSFPACNKVRNGQLAMDQILN